MKLNTEEREELAITLDSHGWGSFLKMVEAICNDLDRDVLKYDLSNGPEELVIRKARTEGARKLQLIIASLKQTYSETKKKELRP